MREEEARDVILDRVSVSRQLVTLAKAFLISPDRPLSFQRDNLFDQFATSQGYDKVHYVVFSDTVDSSSLDQVAGYHACRIACAQALWDLIHSGYYMAYGNTQLIEPNQRWNRAMGSSSQSGAWTFEEIKYVMPDGVVRSPFWNKNRPDPITDPDIFVLEAGIEGADVEVVEALEDAVRCIRNELYRPAVTLLGKAMEGEWIELGLALAAALPETAQDQGHKIVENMKSENRGIARKVGDVRSLYNRKDLLNAVIVASGIRAEQLDSVVVWSNVVRESRNAIHFGAKPTVSNSYEKAVVLLIEAAKALGILYAIKRVADAHSA